MTAANESVTVGVRQHLVDFIVVNYLFGDVTRTPTDDESLIESGLVEIEALCYIRGRSIPRRFFVLDEAQQLTQVKNP